MSKPPRALQELMTAVDAGHVDVVGINFGSAPPRRSTHGHGRGRNKVSAPAVVETSSDTSFEFSAVVSYSSASPASMVFSDGQLRAHQFPAVRSSSAGSSQAASPARTSSTGSYSAKKAGVTGSKKRVSFAMDGAGKAAAAANGAGAGGQRKKSGGGGLLGCMGSACGPSRKDVVVEPARNANRKVVAV